MNLGDKIFKGVLWVMVERLSVQVVSFVLGIVLANLLTPSEYGTIGLLIVFISISQVFIDSGFSKALVQKQNRTNTDISTAFYFNIFIALICYLVLWIFAPYIADYYEIEELSILLKVLAISLFFNAAFSVPNTLLSIEMNFKVISKVTLSTTIISGAIAIFLAYRGFGEWALVYQTLIRSVLMAIIFWFFTKWRPKFKFSLSSFKNLFSFGSKILLSSLLANIVNNFSSLFIAKVISTKELGFYTRGTQFADTAFSTINSVINSVLLPGLAPLQDEKKVLVASTRNIIKFAFLVTAPLFIVLAALADPLIRLLLNEQWVMAIPIMQIICIARLITVVSGINVNLLYVIGRTDLALRQQYLKIIVRVILLVIALPYGIIYVALAELAATILHFFINTYYPGKFMEYGAKNQIKDILKIGVSSILIGGLVYWISSILPSNWLKLTVSFIVVLPAYYITLKIFKVGEVDTLIQKLRQYTN